MIRMINQESLEVTNFRLCSLKIILFAPKAISRISIYEAIAILNFYVG